MENASKALLIAASLLIVILLIAFGMRVFNSTSGSTDSIEQTMNAAEIAQFNSKFTMYAGTGKSAAQVRALADIVIAHNAISTEQVKFEGTSAADSITNYAASLSSSRSYTINISYNPTTQLVQSIDIQ